MKQSLKWFAAVTLILGSFTTENSTICSSIFLILSGILCIPPVFGYIEKKINRQFLTWQKYSLVLFGLLLAMLFGPRKQRTETTVAKTVSSPNVDEYSSSVPSPSLPQKKYAYKVIEQEGRGIYIVLKESDLSANNVRAALEQISKEFYGGECNLNAYDAVEYYNLYKKWLKEEDMAMDRIYDNMNASKESKDSKWQSEDKRLQKKYFVKIADHLIGEYDGLGGNFEYYPFRNEPEYKENGGKR